MKKIVHLIDNLAIGGAQTHLLTMLKCADRRKYSHIVYSLTDEMPLGGEIEDLGIEAVSLGLREPLEKKKWAVAIGAVSNMLKDEGPDLLEAHLTWSRIFGTIASLITGKKRIVAIEQGEIQNTRIKYKVANFLASFFIDVLIANSGAIKRWLSANYWIPGRKITVMHNAVLTDFFKPKGPSGEFKMGLGLRADEVVITSVGTLGTVINKGMGLLIDAVSLIAKKGTRVKLLIVGDGKLKAQLERQVSALGLGDAVRFLGTRRDIDMILSATDIFVLASVFEPFGIALIEAMSMARPVIGSNSGGIPEIIEDGANGLLFTPGDPEDLAEKTLRLIRDAGLREEMGSMARKSVEERFNAGKYVRDLESIYDGLLRG